jgi:hypothetical protein
VHPPIEGRLESGFEGMDVGHRLRVQLVRTDVERGYIDFQAGGVRSRFVPYPFRSTARAIATFNAHNDSQQGPYQISRHC